MATEKKQLIIDYMQQTLSVFTAVLPLAISAAVFIGFHYIYGIGIALISSRICAKNAPQKIMPAYSTFLILMFAAHSYGLATLSLAAFVCGIVSVAYCFLPEKFKIQDNPITAGIMLATAITVTVMLTTHYFGIGASGNTVKEMIASYLSLGFHPNWRGVLYGTVVMVIMLTFPRKFKNFCNTVKAPFIAIVITLVLNLFLNPADMKTAINEIGNNFIFDKSTYHISFFLGEKIDFTAAIICGMALFFVCNYAMIKNDTNKSDYKISAMTNTLFGTVFALILPYGAKFNKKGVVSGIGAALLCILIPILSFGLIDRIPIHSLAVVLIVGAWESVEWFEIKKAFSSPVSVICFVASVGSCLMFGIVYGIIISAVISTIYSLVFKSSQRLPK